MAHIVEFRIEGLVGRKTPYELTLNKDVNVFFGLNGSGKTSLLKILNSAMSGDATMLLSVPFDRAEVVIYSVSAKKNLRRTFDRAELTDQRPVSKFFTAPSDVETPIVTPLVWSAHQLDLAKVSFSRGVSEPFYQWTRHDEDQFVGYAHSYLPTSRLYITDQDETASTSARSGTSTDISEEQLDSYFARAMERLWLRYAAEILSEVRKAQETGLSRILQNILTTERPSEKPTPLDELDSKMAYQRVSSFLQRQGSHRSLLSPQDFQKRYEKDSRRRSVVAEIDAVEQGIEVVMAPRLQLQTLIQRMFSGNKKIVFTDQAISVATSEDQMIGLASLSSGEKHLLRLLVETLLVGSSSMLVDEPELSLHVDWQRQLIADFRLLNKEAQYILATHSPEVMAEVDDSKIFRL